MCNNQLNQSETLTMVDSPPLQSPPPDDNIQRVKFLCSFGGSIMPRPQDGKLRYVGGETRIISLPRDINYDELMNRMRELFDGAVVLKYQQPDEDLDALVSVVNDDDVTNMMEEYDKLGSGDGFTRLRMFLFPHPDHDSMSLLSSPGFDSDERESERRYVDALNSLNDGNEFIRQSPDSSPVIEPMMNVEFGRNCEMPPLPPQFNLRHLTIPHLGSVVPPQHQQQPHTQRYSEMEAPWSPAYYSPRQHHGHHDSRPPTEFPSSPSSGRYRAQFGEFLDNRIGEEYSRQLMGHQPQSPFTDNMVWLPAGAIPNDSSGFPVNLGHPQTAFEGNSICEHCRMSFQRNPGPADPSWYPDPRWIAGAQPHMESSNVGNEFHQYATHCVDCNPGREVYGFNQDANLEHGVYPKEQNDPRIYFNEAHNHERGWAMHPHHLSHRGEDPRISMSGAGWINEQHVPDGSVLNGPTGGQGNCIHQVASNCVNHVDPRCLHGGPELGDHSVGAGSPIQIPAVDGMRYANIPAGYGIDNNAYQVPHGPLPPNQLWIKMNPLRASPSYEALNMIPQANGTVNSGLARTMREGSPSFRVAMDNPNPYAGQPPKIYGVDGSSAPECPHGCTPKLNLNTLGQENQNPFAPDHVRSPHDMIDFVEAVPEVSSSVSAVGNKLHVSTTSGYNPVPSDVNGSCGAVGVEEKSMLSDGIEVKFAQTLEVSDIPNESKSDKNEVVVNENKESGVVSNGLRPAEENGDLTKLCETDDPGNLDQEELCAQRLSFLPDLIASVKKAALEGAKQVKVKVQANAEGDIDSTPQESALKELEPEHAEAEAEADLDDESEGDHPKVFGIEQTKAEAEALDKGLQTIKNDDLEEIRELGSGTYGSVYHGKWKGSDVAIKRIKASCFAGRPSERERLIADFWKEALILSSLHHPNVVSFYGIVRDGPDGSLATVTEFMINGSLKQFLQKKDRTIDRRKRLLIAMDTAFGMEYLHGKNIVHFDLKCENLLVNMRDPHRPICKIGDLGLSKVKQHTLVSGGVRGTLPWMAPELLSGKSNMVTEKIDVYSFAIVMWELLTGEEPYADMHCASIIGGIVNNSLRPQIPSWCDPEWKSLMESCWGSDPGERPSFSEISQKLRKMAAAINVK